MAGGFGFIPRLCAGGGAFSKEEKGTFSKLGLINKVLSYPADNETLSRLYSNALIFVFPSLYEGFGIPALEAMNCDCPMVLSNRGSLPEVAYDAAIYFNPVDIIDIANRMEEIIYDDTLRQTLIDNGRRRRRNFSWAKTRDETRTLYNQIGD